VGGVGEVGEVGGSSLEEMGFQAGQFIAGLAGCGARGRHLGYISNLLCWVPLRFTQPTATMRHASQAVTVLT
jgi:hypothetical protein